MCWSASAVASSPLAGIEVHKQDDLRALRDGLLRLAALRRGVALGVLDHVVVLAQPGGLERVLEEAAVRGLPAVRGLRVGEQDRDLALQLGAARVARAAAAAAVVV